MEIYAQKTFPIARWIIFALLALLLAGDIALVVTGNAVVIDQPILDLFVILRNGFFTFVFKAITFCSDTYTVVVICIILLILPSRARFGIPVTCGVIISSLLNSLLKHIFERPRPDAELHLVNIDSFSFPSGHSMTGLVLYLFLMILLRRYLVLKKYYGIAWAVTIVLGALAFLVGLSRIYLGVHFPTDVFGGWLIGGMLLIILFTVYEAYYPQKYLLTYDPPAWQDMGKRRPWRKPAESGHEVDPIEFPRNQSPWRRAKISPQRQQERATSRMLQENQDPDPGYVRRQEQMDKDLDD